MDENGQNNNDAEADKGNGEIVEEVMLKNNSYPHNDYVNKQA